MGAYLRGESYLERVDAGREAAGRMTDPTLSAEEAGLAISEPLTPRYLRVSCLIQRILETVVEDPDSAGPLIRALEERVGEADTQTLEAIGQVIGGVLVMFPEPYSQAS